MSKYAKAIVGAIGMGATVLLDLYGDQLGLPADWPQTLTAVATPIAVYFFPNTEA